MLFKKGWRSRKPRRSRKKRLWLLLGLVAALFLIQSFIFVEHNMKGPLMHLAKVRVKQMATQAINLAITERISQSSNVGKLIEWKMDSSGKINGFMLNYAEHMKITSDTINVVQQTLNQVGEVPEHIPLGQVFGSAIIGSFGPKVPVQLVPAGAVKVDLATRQSNAGINMILVEVYIRILAEVSIIIPFDAEGELVETEIPISYVLVVGDVPTYYMDNKGNPVGGSPALPPGISIPALSGGTAGAAGSSGSAGSTDSRAGSGAGNGTGAGAGSGSLPHAPPGSGSGQPPASLSHELSP
ncbi:sporulation protein YunB [Paenibacillus sp. y28]|uniref:sporulation protein YunB n=1 Tax=Paenibacillus sp. y28 TaxID=3129110 RepID=UPI003018F28A